MFTSRPIVLSFAAAAFSLSAPVLAQAAGSGPSIAVPHVAGMRDLGRAPATTRVSLALTLPYQHAAELTNLIAAQSTEGSPLYGRFLSNAQFDAYFAPSAGAYARVEQTLRQAGFSIAHEYANRTLIVAAAPVRVAERTFGTEIHRISQGREGVRYANVRPATVPAQLTGLVDTVVGLDNLHKAHWMHEFGPRRVHDARGGGIGKPLNGPDGGFGPLALANGFDFPVQHGFDGTGEAVANVAGDVLDTDLSSFESAFHIKRTGQLLRTTIETPGQDANVEATLDAQTMASLDPGADVHLYILEDPIDTVGEQAYNQIVTDNSVVAVNSSFGVCEASDITYAQAAQKIIQQGESKGISWSASTGDGGAFECGGSQLAPAVIPEVTGVGGTSLFVNKKGKYQSESAWDGGGGGISAFFALPRFQKGVSGLGSTTMRNLPDISFPADPGTGYSFYYQGQWDGPIGGTSWASPTFVALQAEIDQMKGARAGETNPGIYRVFKKSGYKTFNDVTTGNNGYPATTGYDNATGIGSIKGFLFANRV